MEAEPRALQASDPYGMVPRRARVERPPGVAETK